MIITNIEQGWDSKVNFTDENDVFVGYDTEQQCCESAGYFFTESMAQYEYFENSNKIDLSTTELAGYKFDTSFFVQLEGEDLEDGGQVVFKLTKVGCKDIYLNLFNSHNGYYSHGFTAKVGGDVWEEGYL